MRKTIKASTLRDNQSHGDVTVSIAAAIVMRNLKTPPNVDEDDCRQLVVARSWFRRAA